MKALIKKTMDEALIKKNYG